MTRRARQLRTGEHGLANTGCGAAGYSARSTSPRRGTLPTMNRQGAPSICLPSRCRMASVGGPWPSSGEGFLRQMKATHAAAVWRAASGGAAADQPDGCGDEHCGQRELPAALDPLEWPEPAGRMVNGPLRVAVPGEALCECFQRNACLARPRWNGRAELVDEGDGGKAGEGEPAVLGRPLADDPRGAGRLKLLVVASGVR